MLYPIYFMNTFFTIPWEVGIDSEVNNNIIQYKYILLQQLINKCNFFSKN